MMDLRGTYFVTGTDTDVGKTYVCKALLDKAKTKGASTLGLKPLASGSIHHKNSDALCLQQSSSIRLAYEQHNPFCFEPPIAPHIASQQRGQSITAALLAESCKNVPMEQASLCLIEGAGGYRVPINDRESWVDVIRLLDVPVILVVGMKLGCINHALLTEAAMLADNVVCAGWIANQLSETMPVFAENLASLQSRMQTPYLGLTPYVSASHINQ